MMPIGILYLPGGTREYVFKFIFKQLIQTERNGITR